MKQKMRDSGKKLMPFRRVIVFALHVVLAAAAFSTAFLLRFDFDRSQIPDHHMLGFTIICPLAIILKLIALQYFDANRGLWRYAGISDLMTIAKACAVSSVLLILIVVIFYGHGFPRSVHIVDFILSVVFFGGIRFASRLFRESLRPSIRRNSGKPTLIIGAGDAGETALRSLTKGDLSGYQVLGFLDDDPNKQGKLMHGFQILGKVSDLPAMVQEYQVSEVLIAISSVSKKFIREVVESCSGQNIGFHIMPPMKTYMSGDLEIEPIRKVKVEDLLGRDPVKLDRGLVEGLLKGKSVMITGAGGSIGSEIARQVASFCPEKIILVDFAESALFETDFELHERFPKIESVANIVNVRNQGDLEKTFSENRPHCVFHAAAYKHVSLMEQHPSNAVCTNVMGTRNVVEAAVAHKVEKFVLISTDKAVRPTNVMGATKRLCELVVARQHSPNTQFASVRFGNVLGSNGSVIPIFEKQISKGGPVRVTDPEMTRFFMTIPEAVELVLQTSAIAESNDVYVLDMGNPVKIIDLARNMIELSGMVVDEDIKIEIIGARPGEKIHEELITYGEDLLPTNIKKIKLLRKTGDVPGGDAFEDNLKTLEELGLNRQDEDVKTLLWHMMQEDQCSA
ncbi:MAG: hypothetical protein CBC00_10120 [Verrucomicrobia bacterium TMED40]|nr:MAG: hypothetical protein CBC00_10120 [Verrucomicrobia bacterium TMED40]|tara:strand:- start:2599 stop:4470 length:1872 start_codon:yes stop_codon:yes gene_type:complete